MPIRGLRNHALYLECNACDKKVIIKYMDNNKRTSIAHFNQFQVTNYGLGGLCEQHIDPHGYLEGKDIPPSRESLKYTGDMIGTFMAWLKDVDAGGGSSFLIPGNMGTFHIVPYLI